MELKDKIMRSIAQNVAEKAIQDMKINPLRSIRRMLDLGMLFSHGEQQKQFFSRAEQIVRNTNSPYKKIAANLVNNINSEHLVRFGLNFGYNGFSYGANILRKTSKKTGIKIPWLIKLELRENRTDNDVRWLRNTITEARNLGIYTYILHLHSKKTWDEKIFSVATQFQDCAFFVAGMPGIFSEALLNKLEPCLNILYCVTMSHSSDSTEVQNACTALTATKRIFGCSIKDTAYDARTNGLQKLQAYGFYFAIFHQKNLCDAETCYQTILSLRENGHETIIPAALKQDADHIQSMIYGTDSDGILRINSDGNIRIGNLQYTADPQAGLSHALQQFAI